MNNTLDMLLAAIRTAAGRPAIDWSTEPEKLTGGFWAEIWRVSLSGADGTLDGELVARVMPEADVAARETAVQAHLSRSGYPTPIVRLSSGPGPDLDRAWMLMDLAAGKPLLADLSGPGAIVRLPRIARSMPDKLAYHAAALHEIEHESLHSSGDETPDLIERLHTQAIGIGRNDLVTVVAMLRDSRPSSSRTVICHGDLHPFNILSDVGGDTVLDWSSARITDPAYDIAYTQLLLRHPPLETPRPLAPIITSAGRFLARRFTRSYDEVASAPIDPAQLQWFSDYHALGIMTEVATWHAAGELDQHPGHPFLALCGPLGDQLERNYGTPVKRP